MRRLARLTAFPSADSWNVPASTTWRRINSGSSIGEHYVEFILSDSTFVKAESLIEVSEGGGSGQYKYYFGFGVNSTTANSATQSFGYDEGFVNGAPGMAAVFAKYESETAAGKVTLNMVEQNTGSNRAVTAYGDNGGTIFQSGMIVEVML